MKTLGRKVISCLSIFSIGIGMAALPVQTASAAGGVAINDKNFPDRIMRSIVAVEFDEDGNGYLSREEIETVTDFSFSGYEQSFFDQNGNMHRYNGKIRDLTGIEYFTELESLFIGGNEITKLDLSKNEYVYYIYCPDNNITDIKFTNQTIDTLCCYINKIDTLDISMADVNYLIVDPSKVNFKHLKISCYQELHFYPFVDKQGNEDDIRTSVANKDILTLWDSGLVTGERAGTSDISITYQGRTATVNVRVLYRDVTDPSSFWYEPTYSLSDMNVVKGYENQSEFRPANDCTRAQMVTFLWRLAGEPKPKSRSTKFKDIKKSAYYYDAVLWAVEKGITTGVSKTKFKPSGVCTRAQTVTFLWRMAGKPTVKTEKNPFKDVKKKDYFYEPVLWASEQKIVAGYKDKTFRPQGKCLRRQMVTFLYKYVNNVGI